MFLIFYLTRIKIFFKDVKLQALDLLLTRQSCPRLSAPAPNQEQINIILDAATRVPDHGSLTPWEFIIVKGEGLTKLAEIFKQATFKLSGDENKANRAFSLPARAPMMIICVAKCVEHVKIPILEQQISAACSVMAMQQSAFALGYGGIWRTGELAFNSDVNEALNLNLLDQIVGFLYLGSQTVEMPVKPRRSGQDFARYL